MKTIIFLALFVVVGCHDIKEACENQGIKQGTPEFQDCMDKEATSDDH